MEAHEIISTAGGVEEEDKKTIAPINQASNAENEMSPEIYISKTPAVLSIVSPPIVYPPLEFCPLIVFTRMTVEAIYIVLNKKLPVEVKLFKKGLSSN